MSSGNALSDMAQKQVEFDLVEGRLVVSGIDKSVFSVECAQPKLNLRQLYTAVFSDIIGPTKIIVSSTAAVSSDKHAKAHFCSIKKIIDDAQDQINEKLPAVLAERARINKCIEDSMREASAGALGSPEGLAKNSSQDFS